MHIIIGVLILLLSACESNPPAPVIERTPQSKKPTLHKPNDTKPNDSKLNSSKDWRPDTHIVKKGDTLFSIGLEYGYDYKEIAAANNISAPYPIQIGQKLNLVTLKNKTLTAETSKTEPAKTEDGVVITPMKTDSSSTETKPVKESKAVLSAVTPILSEPKALREAYSIEAFNRNAATKPVEIKASEIKANETKATEIKGADAKPTDVKTTDVKPIDVKPIDVKPIDDEAITWVWPTQGKVAAGFDEASNKGLDISGAQGQAIMAASSGKVIYSGSDLRGYGKLVIIKHNKTFLSVYAHNSKIMVKEGQIVAANQKIAEMGNTDSNTVKLHFEIRRLGKSVDPAKYLN